MKIDTEIRHVTPAQANVFEELGFDTEEAQMLKAISQRLIDVELRLQIPSSDRLSRS